MRAGVAWRPACAGVALGLSALAGCGPAPDRRSDAAAFPAADRAAPAPATAPLAESRRDQALEAQTVMDLAGVRPGMTVADIGAGEGYYTVRLAPRVGARGRVLAEDIDPEALRRLGDRVQREQLDNVSITLGGGADPNLPGGSFDRIFLVDVYGIVGQPYAFLWHLRPTLRPGGEVVVFDRDAPTGSGGMPAELLRCEFAASGFRLVRFARKPQLGGYFAAFAADGPRPEPSAIVPCRDPSRGARRG